MGIRLNIGGLKLGSSSGSSWTHYWTQRIYDFGDSGLDKWVVTNPETTVAEFESLKGINMYTLNAIGSTVYSNNIKTFDSRVSGCWVFSYLDVPVAGYPASNQRAGLINAGNTAGCELLRDATGDESVLTFRIFTASTERYKVATTVKEFGMFKITIDASHNINLYVLLNDVWVQQGTEQTYDVGSVSVFMSTKGAVNVARMSKNVIRDLFIRDADDLDFIDFFTHLRSPGLVPDGVTDNLATANAILAGGSDLYLYGGDFLFSGAVQIPSNRTVWGKNCLHKMGVQSLDNFYRNSDLNGGNTNVNVKGLGNFCWHSDAVNNDDSEGSFGYQTYGPLFFPSMGEEVYRYMGIPMVNVNRFEISGINIIEYNHWCIVPQKSSNFIINDVFFNFLYCNPVESNKDGIDILPGCHDYKISNIRGKTQDDFLGLFPAHRIGMIVYTFEGWDIGDVYNGVYENIDIFYSGYFAYRILGEGVNSIYNISSSNIKIRQAGALLHVGLSGYYVVAPTRNTVRDVSFDNTRMEIQAVTGHIIMLSESCSNIIFTNLVNATAGDDLIISAGKDVVGISINGVVYPAPTVVSAVVTNTNKDKVAITLSEALDENYVSASAAFALAGKTITNVAVSGPVVTLTVSVAYAYGDVITVDYTKPASDYLRDVWGAIVATFADQVVTNNISEGYPAVLEDGNTVAWFDMNLLITAVANVVSAWGDRTGLGHHLLQTTEGSKPTLTEDGVLFDGFNDYMKCNAFDLKQPTMIYAVLKQVAWASGDVLWDGNAAANRCGLTQVTSTPRIASFSVWTQNIVNDNLALDTFGIIRAIYNGASSSLQVDNSAKATGTNNNNEPDGFVLGGTYIGTGAANIQVKALIIRKVSDGAEDQTAIYNYLAAKFGLATI